MKFIKSTIPRYYFRVSFSPNSLICASTPEEAADIAAGYIIVEGPLDGIDGKPFEEVISNDSNH